MNLLVECMCSNKRLHCLPCSVQPVGLSELVCCLSQIQQTLYLFRPLVWNSSFEVFTISLDWTEMHFLCTDSPKFLLQVLPDGRNMGCFLAATDALANFMSLNE